MLALAAAGFFRQSRNFAATRLINIVTRTLSGTGTRHMEREVLVVR